MKLRAGTGASASAAPGCEVKFVAKHFRGRIDCDNDFAGFAIRPGLPVTAVEAGTASQAARRSDTARAAAATPAASAAAATFAAESINGQ